MCRKIGPEMQTVPENRTGNAKCAGNGKQKRAPPNTKTLRNSNNTWVGPVNGPFPPERPVSTGQGVRIAVSSLPQGFASRSYERQVYERVKSIYVHAMSPFKICIMMLCMSESMHAKSAASRTAACCTTQLSVELRWIVAQRLSRHVQHLDLTYVACKKVVAVSKTPKRH